METQIEHFSNLRNVPATNRRAMYMDFVKAGKYRQDTLENRISADVGFESSEIEALESLLCKRCQPQTRSAFRQRLRNGLSQSFGIYGRVVFDSRDEKGQPAVEYVAGQSYPDEVRRVRELIIRKG